MIHDVASRRCWSSFLFVFCGACTGGGETLTGPSGSPGGSGGSTGSTPDAPPITTLDASVRDDAVTGTDGPPTDADDGPAGSPAWFAWNLSQPPLTEVDLEKRKIYNTRKYSQSNQGHAFTAVLRDGERKALLEYLKTL